MNNKINCIVVDDEPLARLGLIELIKNTENLNLLEALKNGEEALEYIQNNNVDLVFLDIQMDGINGIELIQELEMNAPLVIYITAYPKFAVESYTLNAIDYLLKPLNPERFKKAVLKAEEYMQNLRNKNGDMSHFFVKSSGRFVRINIAEITHISGMQNYIKLHFKNEKPLILHSPLKSIFNRLSQASFIMIHKSYLVNFAHINSVSGNSVFMNDGIVLPLSRNYKAELLGKINSLVR